ncbi:hypothetical protein [Bradyrhizobium denitrificans]|uniref:hypothetical protein n=1 Tax=Bradyrhizobium denitrificans TaxID=2734912 RepID=UPI00155237D8|nr:hypothetical protein [Bradyrhizobium sp. LMG 8443]NPU23994.1 hypothetical protein [Bradyrhizobium sp. LMG 8443]
MNAIVNIDTITAEKLFAPDGVEKIITKLETDVRAIATTDVSTEAGRTAIRSLAFQIARSKTGLDALGKEHVAGLKKQAKAIDETRAIIWDRLEALQEQVRKPLTDWENTEKARVQGHEDALAAIIATATFATVPDSADCRARLATIRDTMQRDWQEYGERANQAAASAEAILRKALEIATKREAEAAELEQLRAEKAARDQRDREEAIARDAADRARAEAAAEQQRAEQERQAAVARAEQAEREAKEAVERAERDRLAAIDAERARAAAEAKRLADEAAARERNTALRRKVNNAAVAAMVEGGLTTADAQKVVALIAQKKIPAVTIAY